MEKGQCSACTTDCLDCENGTCTRCIEGYKLTFKGSGSVCMCEDCEEGFSFIDSLTGERTRCADRHVACDKCTEYECVNCKEGFIAINGVCVSGNLNEFTYDPLTGNLVRCNEIWSNCASCNEFQCMACFNSYSKVGNDCAKNCEYGCEGCVNEVCTECAIGYWNSFNGCNTCGYLFPNCVDCDKSGCYDCEKGYELSEGFCITSSDSSLGITLLIILLVVFFVVLGGVVLLVYLVRKKKLENERKAKPVDQDQAPK